MLHEQSDKTREMEREAFSCCASKRQISETTHGVRLLLQAVETEQQCSDNRGATRGLILIQQDPTNTIMANMFMPLL